MIYVLPNDSNILIKRDENSAERLKQTRSLSETTLTTAVLKKIVPFSPTKGTTLPTI